MLRGEKVVLRTVTQEDLPKLWSFRQDVDLVLMGDDEPPVPKSFEAYVQGHNERERHPEQGITFAIDVDGVLIGGCSLFHFDALSKNCEIGIAIGDRDYLGRGYGTDAVRVLLHYAFSYRNMHRVYLAPFDDNERAIRSYEKCGFVEEGRLREHIWNDGRYKDLVYMGILRREWESRRG